MEFDRREESDRAQETRGTEDAVEWARAALDFEADGLQAQILRSESQRGILNCSRQWGKSTVTAAKGDVAGGEPGLARGTPGNGVQ